MSQGLNSRAYVPFHHVVSDKTDEVGFTKDGKEQQVRYPEHMNIKTRIYYDPRHHVARITQGVDGASVVFVPLGTGEMNDVAE